jgi:hypothetical protein
LGASIFKGARKFEQCFAYLTTDISDIFYLIVFISNIIVIVLISNKILLQTVISAREKIVEAGDCLMVIFQEIRTYPGNIRDISGKSKYYSMISE